MSGFNWNRPETCRKRTGTCRKTPDITGPWKQYSGTDFSGFSRWFPMISGGNQQELGGTYRKNPEISRSGILLPWNRGNAREPAVSRAGCFDLGPCSNAFVEGVFSHMKSAWTASRNSMVNETIAAELKIRLNNTKKCGDFFLLLKHNRNWYSVPKVNKNTVSKKSVQQLV